MKSLTLLISFLFFNLCTLNAQNIEEIKVSLEKAGDKILSYFPAKINIDEQYIAKVDVEFPNGFNLTADEDTKAVLNYRWGNDKSLQLLFNIDSDGNIIADKYHLMNIFKTDWDVDWTIEFDSKGMMKSAGKYYKHAKEGLLNWWNN